MASLPSLISRLNSLTAAHRQTQSLIQRLQKLSSPSPIPEEDELYDPDARLEIASDIQSSLKDQEDELEILRLDVEDLIPTGSNGSAVGNAGSRWVGGAAAAAAAGTGRPKRDNERDNEKERIAAQVYKLSEDLKSARHSFRRAQLDAKRYADAQRAQERAELFAPPPPLVSSDTEATANGTTTPPSRPASRATRHTQQTHKHLTQDDLTLAASTDVTNALRRTHDLLQSSVEQSQFASETLATSTAALASLSEKYSSLDTVLASSRSLVSSLIRSQKSDTWYLETAFWLCVGTLGWLIFRRWIYGPMWWLVWLPLKWMWWAMAGIASSPPSAASSVSISKIMPTTPATVSTGWMGIPTNEPGEGGCRHMHLPGKGGGWGRRSAVDSSSASSSVAGQSSATPMTVADSSSASVAEESSATPMIDKIGEMAERVREQMVGHGDADVPEDDEGDGGTEKEKEETNVDDITAEERERQENIPRNPKKRMWEEQDLSKQRQGDEGRVRDEL